jgi:hypothetical protein
MKTNPTFVLLRAIAEAQAALADHETASELSADIAIARIAVAIENDDVGEAMRETMPETEPAATLRWAIAQMQDALAEAADPSRSAPASRAIAGRLSGTLHSIRVIGAIRVIGNLPNE